MDPVDLAERALVGSLLRDPQRVGEVAAWLRASDFADAQLAAIYEAIQRQQTSGDQTHATSVAAQVSAAQREALAQEAPPAAHVDEYGRMVLEASVRREVESLGLRVESSTLAAAPATAAAVEAAVAETLQTVTAADMRWAAATSTPAPAAEQPTTDRVAQSLSLASAPGPEQVAAAERGLLHAVLHDPQALTRLAERFRPQDFAEPTVANAWRAAVTLHQAGQPVDLVTVAWEQQRQSRQHGPGLPVAELRAIASVVTAPSPELAAVAVSQATLHRLATKARTAVQEAARNPGLTPQDLLHTASTQYAAVAHAARRLAPPAPPVDQLAARRAAAGRRGAVTQQTPAQRLAETRARERRRGVDRAPALRAPTPQI